MTFTYEDYQSNRPALQAKHGKEIKFWLEPSDPAVLDTILKNADSAVKTLFLVCLKIIWTK